MYKIIKLITGEYVFGKVDKIYSDMSIGLEDPRLMVYGESSVLLMVPYTSIFTDDKSIVFNDHAIVCHMNASSQIVTIYNDTLAKPKKSKGSRNLQ